MKNQAISVFLRIIPGQTFLEAESLIPLLTGNEDSEEHDHKFLPT